MVVLLGIADFPHVESTNSANCIVLVYLCWGLALCLGKDNVQEVFGCGDNSNVFEIVHYHGEGKEGKIGGGVLKGRRTRDESTNRGRGGSTRMNTSPQKSSALRKAKLATHRKKSPLWECSILVWCDVLCVNSCASRFPAYARATGEHTTAQPIYIN